MFGSACVSYRFKIRLSLEKYQDSCLCLFLVAGLSPVQKKAHSQSVFLDVGLPDQIEISSCGLAERCIVEPLVLQDGPSPIHVRLSLAEAQLTLSSRNLKSPLI